MNLVLIGISGSGKGTQGDLLAQKYGLKHISTGEIFRQEYEKKSAEGMAAFSFWSQGKWVPDDVTFALLKIYLANCPGGFVIDGFPRTKNQCIILDDYLSKSGNKLDNAIYLKVSEDEALKRLRLRGEKDAVEKGKSREDEKEEIIRARFKSFTESAAPVLEYYSQKGLLLEINGEQSIEKIFSDLVAIFEKT